MRIVVILLSGCLTSTVEEVRQNVELAGGISSVVVAVPTGDLTVEVADVDEPELIRTIRWTGQDPDVDAWRDGSVLHLDVDCRSVQLTCEVDHVLRVPSAVSLTAEIGSGHISGVGLADRVDVQTERGNVALSAVEGTIVASSGDGRVRVEGVVGTLSMDTGTGDLVAVGADVSEVLATSGSGSVDLALVSTPDRVVVDSGAGDLSLSVPVGTYRIDARTGSGQVSISGITDDADAPSVIDLETGRGDIVIEAVVQEPLAVAR